MTFAVSPPSYQVGGSLRSNNPYYVTREADNLLLRALQRGDFCYVLAARQMGKSSLLVKTRAYLEGMGYHCASIDMTSIGSDNITPQQWYRGLIYDLHRGFYLSRRCNLKNWLQAHENLAPTQQLSRFIEELVLNFFPTENLAIFVDEIDSVLSLNFPVDDFFALIRYFYNQRATNSAFNRFTFTILGVATPSSLIQDTKRTPFNIGVAIPLRGFSLAESMPLGAGLKSKSLEYHLNLLKQILEWTQGQPFLTQKLCQLVFENLDNQEIHLKSKADFALDFVNKIVQNYILNNWEITDRPEHLRSIVNRLLSNEQRAGKLLGIYQAILQEGKVSNQQSAEQDQLLLSGLVTQKDSYLVVANPIYQAIFNLDWTQQKLNSLRPYSQSLNAWRKSHCSDSSRLLRGQALRDAQLWSRGKQLDSFDYQFLAASEELDRLETEQKLESERAKAIKTQLQAEIKNTKLQKLFLAILSAALFLVSGFGVLAFWQYRNAKISETKALITSSQGLFSSHNQLEAMVAALKARRSLAWLQRLGYQDQDLSAQADLALRQTVFNNNEINRLIGHQGSVLGVAVSPDDSLIATASNDKTVKLWSADGALLRTFSHTSTIHRVAFAPDSRRIVSGTLDGRVWIWQTDGKLLQGIKAHSAPVWGVAFSPEGNQLASASGDGTAKIWSLEGRLLHTLQGHNVDVWAVAFSPDGQRLATASIDRSLVLWSRSGQFLRRLKGHQGPVWDVDFCSNQTLASVSSDRTVKLWQTDGRLQRTLQGDNTLLGVSCRGGFVAASGKNNLVKIWQEDGVFQRSLPGHNALIRDVALTTSGNRLVSGSDDGTAKVWRRNQHLVKPLHDGTDTLWFVAISPDGRFLASAEDEQIQLYDRQGNFLQVVPRRRIQHSGSIFSFDSRWLISTSFQGDLLLWPLQGKPISPAQHPRVLPAPRGLKMALATSPDGQMVAAAGDSQTIWLYDLKTQTGLRLGHLPERIWALSFSADGQTLVSASEDGTAKLWNRRGKLLATLNHGGAVWGAAISPKESLVATTSREGTWKLWDFQGNLLKTVAGQSNGLTRVAFSPDGQTLATGGIDNTVKLWNLQADLLTTLPGHRGSVVSVTFSPDGKFLLSGGGEGVAMLWNLEKIKENNDLRYACDWLRDYLAHSQGVPKEERRLCSP